MNTSRWPGVSPIWSSVSKKTKETLECPNPIPVNNSLGFGLENLRNQETRCNHPILSFEGTVSQQRLNRIVECSRYCVRLRNTFMTPPWPNLGIKDSMMFAGQQTSRCTNINHRFNPVTTCGYANIHTDNFAIVVTQTSQLRKRR